LLVAGWLIPGSLLWGVDALSYLPRGVAAVLLGAAALTFVPPVRRGVAAALAPLAARLDAGAPPGAARPVVVAVLALAALLFWLGRAREFFLSDSRLLIDGVEVVTRHFRADALSGWLQGVAHDVLGVFGVTSPEGSFQVVAVLCGVVWLAALFAAIARFVPDGAYRLAIGLLLATTGVTRLFYGYVETSPVVAAGAALYLAAGARLVATGQGSGAFAVAGLFAALLHVTGLLLVPATLLLGWRPRRPVVLGVGAALPVVVHLVLALVPDPLARAGGRYGSYFEEFLPLTGALGNKAAYHLLSWRHGVDLLNEWLILGPYVGVGVVLAGLAVLHWRSAGATERFLAAVLLPYVGLAFVFSRPIGAARDWDLFASVAAPATLLLGLALARTVPRERLVATVLPLAAVSAVALAAVVLVDVDPARSEARFRGLFSPDAVVSRYGRSYALEELADLARYRGDLDGAVRLFEESAAVDPSNVRSLSALGNIHGSEGRLSEALRYFEEAARLRPNLGLSHLYLANALFRLDRTEEAVTAYREALRLDPGLERGYLHLGAALLKLGRIDEALAAWRAGLDVAGDETAAELQNALARYGGAE
jgi:Flp pilus assembly protein TadD